MLHIIRMPERPLPRLGPRCAPTLLQIALLALLAGVIVSMAR